MKAALWRWGAWLSAPGGATARLRVAMLISASLLGVGSAVAQTTAAADASATRWPCTDSRQPPVIQSQTWRSYRAPGKHARRDSADRGVLARI